MSFERLNGTLRRLFGRVRIESSKSDGSLPEYNLLELKAGGVTKCAIGSNGSLSLTKSGDISKEPLYLITINSSDMGANPWRVNQYGGVDFGVYGSFSGSKGLNITSTAGSLRFDNETMLYNDGANILAQRNSTFAQTSRLYGTFTSATAYQRLSTKAIKEAVTCAAGASVTTTISIPKYTHLIGVTTRVTTAIGTGNSTTGYQVGDGTDPDLWGAITGVALGTTSDRTNYTAVDALGPDGSDRTITLTATGGNFDGTGVIEVCAFYLAAEAD